MVELCQVLLDCESSRENSLDPFKPSVNFDDLDSTGKEWRARLEKRKQVTAEEPDYVRTRQVILTQYFTGRTETQRIHAGTEKADWTRSNTQTQSISPLHFCIVFCIYLFYIFSFLTLRIVNV